MGKNIYEKTILTVFLFLAILSFANAQTNIDKVPNIQAIGVAFSKAMGGRGVKSSGEIIKYQVSVNLTTALVD